MAQDAIWAYSYQLEASGQYLQAISALDAITLITGRQNTNYCAELGCTSELARLMNQYANTDLPSSETTNRSKHALVYSYPCSQSDAGKKPS
ncbi:MAG: hypothetical protein WCO71_01895 [Pseudomonadota bacterium]